MTVKVAVVEPVGGHGGMNFYDFALCKSVTTAGGQATLYSCDKTVVSGSEVFAVKLPYRGIYGADKAWVRGLRFLLGSVIALPGARLQGHQVAHFHFFHVGPLELFNVLLARAVGLAVVVTAHDVEAFKKGLSVPIFLRWAYRLASRVIAHSQVAKNELVHVLKLPAEKIDVILHGNHVDHIPASVTRDMARRQLGLTTDQRVLLFFGQIKDVKGLDVLLEGFALARQVDKRLHLVIGGRVWKSDFAKYQKVIDAHGLGPYCTRHIRYITDAEVPVFYRCADLVVLPYRTIYQSGVVLEAMSYGRPVLVSDIAGMLEAVQDEKTGFVFRNGDAPHLALRLRDIFSTPGHSEAIAEAGHRMVVTRNDWGTIGKQTLACYQRALGSAQ